MPKYTITCPIDLVVFTAARKDARYCSEKCKKAAKRKNKRDKPAPKETQLERMASETSEAVSSLEDAGIIPPEKNVADAKASKVKVPARLKSSRSELIERANARLRTKGMPLISEKPEVLYFVDSGVPELNALTRDHDPHGVGGFPRKRITEIFGPKSVGKTTMVKLLIDANKDLRVLFIDAEGGMISPPEEIDIIKTSVLESAEDIMFEAIKSGEYDLVVLDSVSSLVTHKKVEEGGDGMGGKPKAMKNFIDRVNAILQPIGDDGYPLDIPGTAVVFINQLRDTMSSFGIKEFTPGGRSIEYMASLRLEFRSASADRLVRGGKVAGQYVRVKVKKTRFGMDGVETKFAIMYGKLLEFDKYYQERVKELL